MTANKIPNTHLQSKNPIPNRKGLVRKSDEEKNNKYVDDNGTEKASKRESLFDLDDENDNKSNDSINVSNSITNEKNDDTQKDDDEDFVVQDSTDNDEIKDDEIKDNENEYNNSRTRTKKLTTLFQKKQLKELSKILQDTNLQYSNDFNDYQKATEKVQKNSERLISSLLKRNNYLEDKLLELKKNISILNKEKRQLTNELDVEIRRWKSIASNAHERENELESNILELKAEKLRTSHKLNEIEKFNTKTEFLELLTGVNCIDVINNSNFLKFKIKQRGKIGELIYNLTIFKENSDTEEQDAIYQPIWDKPADYEFDWNKNIKDVKEVLPDYLHNELAFPANTLLMFYNKISVSLN